MKVRQIPAVLRPEKVHSVDVHCQQQNVKQNIVGEQVFVITVERAARCVVVLRVVRRDDSQRVDTVVKIVAGFVVHPPGVAVVEGQKLREREEFLSRGGRKKFPPPWLKK